jgi:type I restriction enzyme S subunit
VAYNQATTAITGTAQPTVPLRPLRAFKTPVPPLAEQKRIVAKVEHLMKLCDALETALRRSEDRAAKLAEAVVQEMVA